MNFSGALRKKNPYQKHQEEQEAKKKRADLEAAKLYDDFVESFGGDGPAQTSFVTGGTIQPGSRPSAPGSAKKSSKYVPSFIPPAMAAAMAAVKDKPQESVFALPDKARGAAKKPRQIDLMLENLKRGQQEREERMQTRREMGLEPEAEEYANADDNDPFTTNLYVGNLSPDVDEEVLLREFGRFGPVASVKIMWPRDEDQRRRGRNCGFVAFMSRGHAQRAKDELDGVVLHDQDLKLGWGKAVTLPARALNQGATPGSAPLPSKVGAAVPPPGVEAPPPWSDPHAAQQPRGGSSVHHGNGPDITVPLPADGRQRFVIDTVAAYVLRDGPDFEQALMEKETANPEFAFMFNLQAPEHLYFRWRLYSLAQGDTARNWRVEPFVMLEGGQRWLPPPMTAIAGSGSHQTAAQRGGELRDKDAPLSELQRDRFEDLLRALTAERAAVRDAMTFCLDNAACATEVVDILTESLTLNETPIPTKVARLFLVSDILHNSQAQVRNASRYRARLESALPDIFDSLHSAYRGAQGRVAQEGLRRHVLRVLRVWRSWFIFGDDFLNGLQAMFLRTRAAEAPQPTPELAAELGALGDEALEARCRRSGVSSRGGREAQVGRLAELQAYMSGDQDAAAPRMGPTLRSPADFSEALAAAKAAAAAAGGGSSDAGGDTGATSAAAGPAVGPAPGPKPAEQPAPKPRPDEPVSRWTEIDDDEAAAGGGMPLSAIMPDSPSGSDDIFGGVSAATTPTARVTVTASGRQPGTARDDELAEDRGRQRSPSAEPPLPSLPSPAVGPPPDNRSGVQRSGAAEQAHHDRMRKVELAVMMFKEELEEKGGLSKQAIADQVRLKRAQLTVEAERAEKAEQAAAAAGAVDKGVRETSRPVKRERSSERSRERSRDRTRARERSRDASRDRERASSRPSSTRHDDRDGSRDGNRDKDREKERDRERERDRDRGRTHRARSRSKSRARPGSREREKGHERKRSDSSKKKESKRSRSRSPRKDSKRRR
mmetsp:Transcript_16329/g.48953  ORF Transcript_16329/g.48953 Transcript_16329/m.48953 type:complete len:1001 (+) Transcript_16329:302-3304(+)